MGGAGGICASAALARREAGSEPGNGAGLRPGRAVRLEPGKAGGPCGRRGASSVAQRRGVSLPDVAAAAGSWPEPWNRREWPFLARILSAPPRREHVKRRRRGTVWRRADPSANGTCPAPFCRPAESCRLGRSPGSACGPGPACGPEPPFTGLSGAAACAPWPRFFREAPGGVAQRARDADARSVCGAPGRPRNSGNAGHGSDARDRPVPWRWRGVRWSRAPRTATAAWLAGQPRPERVFGHHQMPRDQHDGRRRRRTQDTLRVTRMPCRLASWLTTNRPSCSLSEGLNSGRAGQPVVQLGEPLRPYPQPAVLDLDPGEPAGDRVSQYLVPTCTGESVVAFSISSASRWMTSATAEPARAAWLRVATQTRA